MQKDLESLTWYHINQAGPVSQCFFTFRKFESGTKHTPSFLESNSVFFLISSYLILLIKVPVIKSYLPLRLEQKQLPLY